MYYPISATVKYKCPKGHIFLMRAQLKPIDDVYGRWMTWRWAFCPKCGMAAEV